MLEMFCLIIFSFAFCEIAGFRSSSSRFLVRPLAKALYDTDPGSDGTGNYVLVGELEEDKTSSSSTSDIDLASTLSANEKMELYFGELKKGKQDQAKSEWLKVANEMGRSLTMDAVTPKVKQEAWRYNNVKSVFSHPYKTISELHQLVDIDMGMFQSSIDQYIDESCKESHLVFIDGVYTPSLSNLDSIKDSAAVITSMSSLELPLGKTLDILSYIPDINELPRNSFGSDLITALNLCYLEDAAVIDIPENLKLETPIQVLYINSANTDCPTASYPRMIVHVGDKAELYLKQTLLTVDRKTSTVISCSDVASNVEDTSNSPHATLVNGNTRVIVGREAKVVHTYEQQLSLQSRHLEVLSSTVQANSSYELTVLQMGSNVARVNVHIDLQDKKANCTLHGLTLVSPRQSCDMHSSIVHDAVDTASRQQQRNVIGSKAEAIFKGRIRIPKHAQLTDSVQLCRTIMAGGLEEESTKGGRLIAMPTLEITADNVVCSHGASVADLDENSMFYLSSRGINRKEARSLLLKGFVFETLINQNSRMMDKASYARVFEKLVQITPKNDVGASESSQKYTSM